jgi:hypothetical protein
MAMPQPLSFTELEIAITKGDVQTFQEAVERAKNALTDMAKGNPPVLPSEPAGLEPVPPQADVKVEP